MQVTWKCQWTQTKNKKTAKPALSNRRTRAGETSKTKLVDNDHSTQAKHRKKGCDLTPIHASKDKWGHLLLGGVKESKYGTRTSNPTS